jgi:hydrogenase nickel incorporation protein HypB
MKQVNVVENVLKLNDEMAALNRQTFTDAGVFAVDLIGAPGCGKTTLLQETFRRLGEELKVGVMVGDLTTQRDADRLAEGCDQVVQINTGRGCHLDANHVRQAFAHLSLADLDVLFIENVGNLICPVGFDLGQDLKVGMFSIAEGDDKAAKHPYLVYEAAVVLLNKMDLVGHVPFNLDRFREDIRQLNPKVELLECSAYKGDGIDGWCDWLKTRSREKASQAAV